VKLKPGRRHIASLVLHARDGDRAKPENQIGGLLVRQLNGALRNYRRDHERDRLRTTLRPVADLLVGEIEIWLADDAIHHEVAADAHLVAAEIEYEFTLTAARSAATAATDRNGGRRTSGRHRSRMRARAPSGSIALWRKRRKRNQSAHRLPD
jgi:hypothetical protein